MNDYPTPSTAYPLDEFFTRFGYLIAPGEPSRWVMIKDDQGCRMVEAIAIRSEDDAGGGDASDDSVT